MTLDFKDLLESLDEAVIIFDELRNCLFLNPEAKQLLEDNTNISAIGDWISLQVPSLLDAPLVSVLPELPSKITLINDQQLGELKVVLRKIDISNEFRQELTEYNSTFIRDPEIAPIHPYELEYLPCEPLSITSVSYDRLTGLPNYNLLLEHIEQEIGFCQQRIGYEFVILFVDVNRFKVINSSLGRILGDRLLIAISERLQNSLRKQDFVARMGNDEFVILLSNVEHLSYATNVAERVYRELAIPFNLGGYEVFIEASIGIAVGNKEYTQPENILRDAELAVSDAKRKSGFPYQIFTDCMRGKALTLLQLENDLRKAIKHEEFILHYQPIISLQDNKIKGFEALVRWRHPKKGIISPGKFIPLAEETGLIIPLGFWVLKEACQQMYNLQVEFTGLVEWKVSVNISSKQLELPNFVARVKQVLRRLNLDSHNLN